MRVHVVLCVLLAAGMGAARGRGDPITCPYPGSQSHVLSILVNNTRQCYQPHLDVSRVFIVPPSTDELRPIFEKRCTKLRDFKSCLAHVQRDADLCLAPLGQKAIRVKLDFLEALAKEMCAAGGETLTKIFSEEFRGLDLATRLDMLKCTIKHSRKVKEQLLVKDELSSRTIMRYRFFEGFVKECILDEFQKKGKSAPNFEGLFKRVLSDMQCISPSTKVVVLCSSLDERERGELERDVSAGDALPIPQESSREI